jgi:hypothetical protein
MSAPLEALAPVISVSQGQTDAPFSQATITDPNISTTDSLTIQITGAGGKLSDGTGFNGTQERPEWRVHPLGDRSRDEAYPSDSGRSIGSGSFRTAAW